MSQSIKKRMAGMSTVQDARELKFVLDALRTDIASLRATVAATNTKLNTDAGVTDTDYAAPAALTTLE